MENFLGEIAALAAALSYSFASTSYTLAGRKFGASVSMALSLAMSLLFLLPMHLVAQGQLFPVAASLERWWLLGLSSLAGFVVSALLLLRAFQQIGPRLTMLIGSTSPIFATVMAWLVLGESMTPSAIFAIALVLGGVLWVVSEDAVGAVQARPADNRRGLLTAFGAAITMGASFTLMSQGMEGGYPALSASLIRTIVGLLLLMALIAIRGRARQNLRLISTEPRALALTALAALAGPVAGTTLVLLSLQYTTVGVSSTLTGTSPIFMIPLAYLVFGERASLRAITGTLVAVAGVALLFAV